jgi:hypothetical protein
MPVVDVRPYIAEAFESSWPTRTKLLWAAMNAWAPEPVVTALRRLPEGMYRTPADVTREIERQGR